MDAAFKNISRKRKYNLSGATNVPLKKDREKWNNWGKLKIKFVCVLISFVVLECLLKSAYLHLFYSRKKGKFKFLEPISHLFIKFNSLLRQVDESFIYFLLQQVKHS